MDTEILGHFLTTEGKKPIPTIFVSLIMLVQIQYQ